MICTFMTLVSFLLISCQGIAKKIVDSIKFQVGLWLRQCSDNPALFVLALAALVAIGFIVIVFIDLAFRKRKMRMERQMYNGERKYPPRKA